MNTRIELARRLQIEPLKAKSVLARNLGEELKRRGRTKAVIGLSGGIDSTLTAALAVEALGRPNVIAVNLPSLRMSRGALVKPATMPPAEFAKKEDDLASAKLAASHLGIELVLQPVFDQILHSGNKLMDGPFTARVRMAWLFYIATKNHALVLGTLNRSEILLGSTVHFGYNAYAFNPIGGLFKTQLWQLAEGSAGIVPDSIVRRSPSPGLLGDQGYDLQLAPDFGCNYADVDPLLYLMFNLGGYKRYKTKGFYLQLQKYGFDQEFVKKIVAQYERNRFKFEVPLVLPFERVV